MTTLEAIPRPKPAPPPRRGPAVRTRRTPLSARGEPAVWIMGAALLACAAMIIGLLGVIVVQGASTFWPEPLERLTLRDGRVLLGAPVRTEPYAAPEGERAAIDELRSRGALIAGATDADGRPLRTQYRVGNREITGQPFVWVPRHEIAEPPTRPAGALLLERLDWGVWIGTPRAVFLQDEVVVPAGAPVVAEEVVGGRRVTRESLGAAPDGGQRVRQRTFVAEGEGVGAALRSALPEAARRRAEIERARRDDLGRPNAVMESWRRRLRTAELELADQLARGGGPLPLPWWLALAGATVALAGLAVGLWRRLSRTPSAGSRRPGLRVAIAAAACAAAVGLVATWLERPASPMDQATLDSLRLRSEAEITTARAAYEAALERVRTLEAEDRRHRVIIEDAATGRFAPLEQTLPDEPLALSQIIRAVPANELAWSGKLGVYLDRTWEFLTDLPRDNNTAGGVLPVIVGTVLLTVLLSICVVPLGVIAALYLREYARQGPVTSAVRIAVNNLAGVPSIVYGVFGLGFFCYTLGQYIDAGPEAASELPRFQWWFLLGGAGLIVFSALAMTVLARPRPGQLPTRVQAVLKRLCAAAWVGAVLLVVALFATTPYFHGFFRAEPTFGSRGLLWGALTLALLTLPVVIVATEEAVAAVPRSMREGSFGCGASRWQTIKRIVLPGAMPGVMTGMILAMARGAGEVAPLMIVGAVKKTDELPVSGDFPFVHIERTFMHLGFHIYDLGFQSPDAEAARPLVWTTTLLLIVIVVSLNLVAVTVRSRLRARLASGHF